MDITIPSSGKELLIALLMIAFYFIAWIFLSFFVYFFMSMLAKRKRVIWGTLAGIAIGGVYCDIKFDGFVVVLLTIVAGAIGFLFTPPVKKERKYFPF